MYNRLTRKNLFQIDINRTLSPMEYFARKILVLATFSLLSILLILSFLLFMFACVATLISYSAPHHPWYHSHSVVRHNKLSEFYLAWRRVFYAGCLNIRVRTISKCATQQKSGRVSLFRCNRNTCYCSSTHPCYPLTSRLACNNNI